MDTAFEEDVLPGGRSLTYLFFATPVRTCTIDFALTLIEALEGKKKRAEVEKGLVR